jgi:hypothetical protein
MKVAIAVLSLALSLVSGCEAGESIDGGAGAQVRELLKQIETAERSSYLRNACEQWTLTDADVRYFLRYAKPITSEEHHAVYDVLPCAYTGKLSRDGQSHEFEINAGSFAWIDGALYGCREQCANLFALFDR